MKKTILLAEDQQAMRLIIRTVIHFLKDFNLIEVENGLEALKELDLRNKLKSERPLPKIDLILCDWNMPKLSGIEVLTKIKNDSLLKNIPFIMLTSQNDEAQVLEAMKLGVSDYITKPFKTSLLEEKIKKHLA